MNYNVLDTIDMKTLGRELQQARIRKGFTQDEAAKIIDVARTTMTAIEKGERRIKAGELIKLAQAYDMPIADLVRPHPDIALSQPQFRGPVLRTEEDNTVIEPYVEQLKFLARNYFELEHITQSPLNRRYPSVYEVGHLSTSVAAENIAIEERTRLGLNSGQIPLLRDILEQDVGLRIFYYPLPEKFSAIYLYDEQVGGCIAVNSNHPEERRRWSLAHDYGHFLTYRQKSTVFSDDAYQRKPESERLADDFATFFLMPTSGVMKRFNDMRKMKESVKLGDLLILAHYYGVSVEAMLLRLEDLHVLPAGFAQKLRKSDFKVREAQQQLGLTPLPTRDQKYPLRYQYLALEALQSGSISEAQFAQFLEVDRLQARKMLELFQQNAVVDNSLNDIPSDVPRKSQHVPDGQEGIVHE
jgi:Zn-dependent peptidase ImmA (M78 family)/DNA-binding XRE family transcriptional regulator